MHKLLSFVSYCHAMTAARAMTLLLAAVLVAGAVPANAQQRLAGPDAKRPKVDAGADTNDAASYLALAAKLLDDSPARAAEAFLWAARIDPASAEAYYGRRVSLLMRRPSDLNSYMSNVRAARENRRFLAIDSLQLRALHIDPFLYRRHDRTMLFAYYRYALKDVIGSMSRQEFEAQLSRLLVQDHPTTRAQYMYSSGRFDQALIEYEDAIRIARNPVWLRMDRARIYAIQGAVPKAIDEFNEVLKILRERDEKKGAYVVFYDSKAVVEHSIGTLHFQNNALDSAKAALGRALTEDMSYHPAHIALGRISLLENDTANAMGAFALAADLAPGDPYVQYLYGSMLVAAGQYSDAIAPLSKAIELEPVYAAPYFSLGRAHEETNSSAEALKNYEKFLAASSQRDPNRGVASQRAAQLR